MGSRPEPLAGPLFGLETEYSVSAFGRNGEPLDRQLYSRRLVTQARRHYAFVTGRDSYDLFLENGARLYIDDSEALGILNTEYASAECRRLEDLIAQIRAGDRMLATLAREIENEIDELDTLFISKTSFDYAAAFEPNGRGHTAGSHENYAHVIDQRRLAGPMLAFLATRPVFSGGGGFNDAANRRLAFMLSPRVAFLTATVSQGAQSHRAIFTLKDEPLSTRCSRLQLLCGEGVRHDLSEYLRFGTTALIVRLIDAGATFPHRIELDPLPAIRKVASDVMCAEAVAVIAGRPVTAIGIQRLYLEWIEEFVGSELLPDWAGDVCLRWRATLDQLEDNPMNLVGSLDWPTKLAFYRSIVAAQGFDWQSLVEETDETHAQIRATLFELDIRFGDVSDASLFEHLAQMDTYATSIVNEDAIARASRTPPQDTRARPRGEWIRRVRKIDPGLSCRWDLLCSPRVRRAIRFPNPYLADSPGWSDWRR